MMCQYPPRFSHDTNFGSLENSEKVVFEVYTKSGLSSAVSIIIIFSWFFIKNHNL